MLRWGIVFGLGFIILLCVTTVNHRSNHIQKVLRSMPQEDRIALEYFFRALLFDDLAAYVLYGNKPMALAVFRDDLKKMNRGYGGFNYGHLCRQNVIFREGWHAWEKYRHHFPFKRFILHQFSHKFFSHDDTSTYILIINRDAFEEVFKKNRAGFISKYGDEITSAKLLEVYLSEESFFSPELPDDVKGVFCGYGAHNAELFQRRTNLELLTDLKLLDSRSQSFNRYREIKSTLQSFANQSLSCVLVRFPCFVADPDHWETKALRNNYREQRKKATQHYDHGNFLELTLKKLTE